MSSGDGEDPKHQESSEFLPRAELRRQWDTLREEWSGFLAQRQSEQDAFVEKLLLRLPVVQGLEQQEPRNSVNLPTTISKAFLAPAGRMSSLASGQDITPLAPSRRTLPIPTAPSTPYRSDKLLMSEEDLAEEAACRMKQFVHEEDSVVTKKTSVRRSRNQSGISEDDDALHTVREFEGRTSALENLVMNMKSSKRLHRWISRLPCGKRFLRFFVNTLDYLISLEEPERHGCCNCILQSNLFGTFCTLTILANVGVILYTANWTMENETFAVPFAVSALDIFFCSVYFVESALKLIVHRAYFFWNEDAGWNVFDLCLVVLAVYDQTMFFVWQSEEEGADQYSANMNFMRSLRIVKVSRILRLVRVIWIFRDLRCMLFSILWSFIPLFWCLVLIFFVILVFSLLLIQLVTEYIIQSDLSQGLRADFFDYFGSVQTTMATLYMSSTGGVDWRVPYEVLADSGELSCAAFLAYIAFFEFAVFNVLTGVFVDHAMKVSAADRELAVAEQKKKERSEAERLRDTCRVIDSDGDGKISWPEFHYFLHYENGYRNMASLGLDIFDSKKFFKNLMVMTNQRDIDITQFVSGCMRMKGGATGIDLHSLYSDLNSMHRRQEEMQALVTSVIQLLREKSIRKRSKLDSSRFSRSSQEEEIKDFTSGLAPQSSNGSGSVFLAPRDGYSVAPEGAPKEALSLKPVRAGALLRGSTDYSLEGSQCISFLLAPEEPVSTKLRM